MKTDGDVIFSSFGPGRATQWLQRLDVADRTPAGLERCSGTIEGYRLSPVHPEHIVNHNPRLDSTCHAWYRIVRATRSCVLHGDVNP